MGKCKLMKESEINEILEMTHSLNPIERKRALVQLCPCRLLRKIDHIWERVFEMFDDESGIVRDQVVHTLADGSPREMETQVVETLERMWNDENDKVKKKVRRVLNSYRRSGKWNVL